MSADRYEINDADHGAIRISHPSAHLPHEFVCIHPGADPWSAFSNGVIRQQSRDIKLLTQMLHDQRLVIDDLEHRRVNVCDENDQLRADLAAAVTENAALLAANRDCIWHFDAIKADYDVMKLRAEQAEARLAAIEVAPMVARVVEIKRDFASGPYRCLDYDSDKLPGGFVELIARPAKDQE